MLLQMTNFLPFIYRAFENIGYPGKRNSGIVPLNHDKGNSK